MEPLAVDVKTAAQMTSLSARTIRRYVGLGRLGVVRVGRRILIPVASLKRLLQENAMTRPVHPIQEERNDD